MLIQDWTIIRPGGLKSDPATGVAILTADTMASGEGGTELIVCGATSDFIPL